MRALCELRGERPEPARRFIASAIRRDPGNWELRYVDALIRAAGRRDPRSALHEAALRNPRAFAPAEAGRAFARRPAAEWPDVARRLPVPLPVER
jgi:hypothetical protein